MLSFNKLNPDATVIYVSAEAARGIKVFGCAPASLPADKSEIDKFVDGKRRCEVSFAIVRIAHCMMRGPDSAYDGTRTEEIGMALRSTQQQSSWPPCGFQVISATIIRHHVMISGTYISHYGTSAR
eukprot:3054846-Rhodomonas_salina.1